MITKIEFGDALAEFTSTLSDFVSTEAGQWTIKGFIDTYEDIYSISSDTKVVSKILEIHIFPRILAFADNYGFDIVLADHQNYYPDLSFVSKTDEAIKYAVDFKTTYRNPRRPWMCNGFTLGSHGTYFSDRSSTKNIQFPYESYLGHFCLGVIYNRTDGSQIDETRSRPITELHSIVSVISNLQFFVAEKWRIASDKRGSGNTANIGSIRRIADIVFGNGMFAKLGEEWFDDYWMNYGKITVRTESGGTGRITSLEEFVAYRGGDTSLIVPRSSSR